MDYIEIVSNLSKTPEGIKYLTSDTVGQEYARRALEASTGAAAPAPNADAEHEESDSEQEESDGEKEESDAKPKGPLHTPFPWLDDNERQCHSLTKKECETIRKYVLEFVDAWLNYCDDKEIAFTRKCFLPGDLVAVAFTIIDEDKNEKVTYVPLRFILLSVMLYFTKRVKVSMSFERIDNQARKSFWFRSLKKGEQELLDIGMMTANPETFRDKTSNPVSVWLKICKLIPVESKPKNWQFGSTILVRLNSDNVNDPVVDCRGS